MSPWLIAGSLAALAASSVGAYFLGDSVGANRVLAREAAATQRANDAAAALATARQDKAAAAASAGAQAHDLIAALGDRGRDTVKEYYRENPAADRPCLDAGRVQQIASARAAATAAATAGSVADPLPLARPAAAGDVER
ncbi:MAG: hypothetical protein JO290_06365 [Sphingomonadaceae bacterium]|nr:hypothetical protein [Sphingomonadaceae bacterium]